jgi:undecaprenyl diphosphate synthase
MLKTIDGEVLNVPEHVAIILDGNGRWAKKKLRPRTFGHKRGAEVLEQICEDAWDIGIKYLTVYAFSTENWKRPQDEVDTLMDLFHNYLVNYLGRIMKNNMRIRFIGDRSGLSEKMQEEIYDMERESVYNTGLNFTIALNYGSRDEMVRAMKRMIRDGHHDPEEFTEQMFSAYLDTADMPDPDLLIRTSGEERLSNYLLWQLAYAEFIFTPVLWPDFTKKDLIDCIRTYTGRSRRYGGVTS